jgi:two-component system LytT family sensor kinase
MKKSVVVLLHIGYWLLFLSLLSFIFLLVISVANPKPNQSDTFSSFFFQWMRLITGFAIIPGALSFYSFYSILFPRFLARKQIARLFLAGGLVSLLSAIAGGLVLSFILYDRSIMFGDGITSALQQTVLISIGAMLNGIVGLVIKGFITSYDDIKVKDELNKKNYEMELALVKAQLNPHFLFNTINNIDVLIGMDAPKASLYLNKLSDIMRFMLYETKTDRIPLADELMYIEKYIDLQRIRTANPDYVHYEVQGDTGHMLIAPMLLIPFVENAFKHSESRKKQDGIRICIIIAPATLSFECENPYTPNQQEPAEKGGLGNRLIEKRIQLLYPGMHTLAFQKEQDTYKVKLVLQRNEH